MALQDSLFILKELEKHLQAAASLAMSTSRDPEFPTESRSDLMELGRSLEFGNRKVGLIGARIEGIQQRRILDAKK